jgi:hypothetical protein
VRIANTEWTVTNHVYIQPPHSAGEALRDELALTGGDLVHVAVGA